MLRTLKGLSEINGVKIAELNGFLDKRPNEFIVVQHVNNGVSFKIQDGPVSENGINGVQVDSLIRIALVMISKLNKERPCIQNVMMIGHLKRAILSWENRKARIEGKQIDIGGLNV